MIPTSALRRVFISSQNVARSACSTQTRGAGLTRNGISIIPGPSLEINQVSRLVRTFVRRTTFTHSQAEVATKPTSILQFVSSNVWKATHRTGGTSFASQFGQPPPRGPWQKLRDAFNRIPNNVIFYGILVLNGCIFVAWQYAHAAYVSTGDRSWILWMNQNFTTSMNNFTSGRLWTILTSCFSHEGTKHLLFNALSFYFMAPAVLGTLGNVGFLGLYLGGGIMANFVSLWWNNIMKHVPISSHGASGAIYSVITFYACCAPRSTFLLFMIVPVPAWLCVSGLFLYDTYSSIYTRDGHTDNAAHVGGVLAGAAYFLAKALRIF